jgi:MtrB/PioB family decaheme-associated outer membrane protein
MKQKNFLLPRRRILTLAVGTALASLVAAPALADPLMTIKLFRDSEVMFRDADMSRWAENYVELGAGYNSANSLRFGQFSGLTDKGGFPLAGFNWIARTEANDAQYWQIHGANLGLDSRKLKAEGGVQGAWEASFSFDGLKKSQTESANFVHDGLGTNNLTLPAGWAAGGAQAAQVTARLRPFEIAQGRDIYRLGLKGLLGNEWDYKVTYREDRRDGTRMTGLPVSANGGSRSFIVPYAIDDKTSQIDAVLSYTSKIAQFQLGYHYSKFTNNFNAFNVQNPFFVGVGQNLTMSLAPSNDLHQITATGGYKLSKDTRLSATLSRSIGKQNDAYLPYSANLVSPTAPNSPSSLQGEVVKTLLDVALTARPIDKMNLKLAYRYHDDKNKTPIAKYSYVSRDNTAATAFDVASANTRSNAPVSNTEKRYTVDADYEVAPKTTLRAGFEHTDKSYTLTDVTSTKTNKLSLELRKPILDEFQGALGYTHTQRRSPGYDKSVFFTNTYTNATFQAAAAGRMTNHPSMRAFLYADYNEDRLRTSGNWTVSETLSLQGVVDAFKQKMRGPNCGQFTNALQQGALGITATLPDSCLGRDTATGTSASLDLQYQPEENLTTFGFLNVVQTGVREVGRNFAKGGVSGADATRDFYGDMTYTDHTAGFGLKWQPEEKWDLGGTYVLNLGRGKSDVTLASGYTANLGQNGAGVGGSVPDTWSRLHSLQLFAKWDYSKQVTWRFNYLYENLRTYDWALSDVGAQTLDNILLTGQQAPRYSNHVFGVSAVVKTW